MAKAAAALWVDRSRGEIASLRDSAFMRGSGTGGNPASCLSSDLENNMEECIDVHVRWQDGYLEMFVAAQVRFGSDLLWLRLGNGQNRHIPLRSVRWFSCEKLSRAGEHCHQ